MKKQTIAVDVDEVLSSEVDALIDFSRERLGVKLTHDNFKIPGEYWTYYDFVWSSVGQDTKALFKEFLSSEFKRNQSILNHDVEVLKKLNKRFRLEIVTSRSSDLRDLTLEMLERSAPNLFDDAHFVDLWSKPDQKATKAYICQQIGAGYLIDDNPEHCNLAAEVGVQAFLFGDWGWSRGAKLHEKVIRVANWQEIEEYFDVDE